VGIDKRQRLPRFAPMTLQEWSRRRGGTANPDRRPVVLFPDTFNNYLHTDVGVACVEAIEAAGWRVIMPAQHVCCGLAGSWGFETGKFGISIDCGEQALLPAVREVPVDTLIVANGFSCRTQIADAGTGRRAPHAGQVMTMALRQQAASAREDAIRLPDPPRPPQPPASRRVARIGAAAPLLLVRTLLGLEFSRGQARYDSFLPPKMHGLSAVGPPAAGGGWQVRSP
jgi:Fe-S oxidoreductase